ncbi:hypothetical protein B0H10DRAFT_2439748 [Mycena sp. CBHHK59/15]|nr:hypothetical protein B0H10DRAFT_2439748 [Mycena sp. CBHHK59/15]
MATVPIPTSTPTIMQKPPKDAVFSGYSMTPSYFKDLMVGLRPYINDYPNETIDVHIGQYDQWRIMLPPEKRAKAPLLKVFHDPSKKINYNNYDLSLTTVFFWSRWVPFGSNDQLDRPQDHPELWQELAEDMARRDELIALIKEHGFSVDKHMLKFGCVKDVHPYYDPLGHFMFM